MIEKAGEGEETEGEKEEGERKRKRGYEITYLLDLNGEKVAKKGDATNLIACGEHASIMIMNPYVRG